MTNPKNNEMTQPDNVFKVRKRHETTSKRHLNELLWPQTNENNKLSQGATFPIHQLFQTNTASSERE